MKPHNLIMFGYLLLASVLCQTQASGIPAIVPTTGVALAPVPPIVPVSGAHQFVARNYNRVYVPVSTAYPSWPTVTTYGTYPTTYYKYGGSYPYPYGYYPSYGYNYGYSYTGGIW